MPAFKTHNFYGVDHIWVGNCNHQLTITNYVYMQNISFLNSKTKKYTPISVFNFLKDCVSLCKPQWSDFEKTAFSDSLGQEHSFDIQHAYFYDTSLTGWRVP